MQVSGAERWLVLRRQALADGVLDTAVSILIEQRRSESERSQYWLTRWTAGLNRSLDRLEAEIITFPPQIDLSQIIVGCALGYLDFRLPELTWRSDRPNLTEWHEKFATRQSMVETIPTS